jgi:molybdate transport system substrate-binding protein
MRRAAVPAVALLLLSGCGGGEPAAGGTTVTVFAAASLTGSFTTLGRQFEAANPGTTVVFNFGPSSGLATSINQGAPADVFASASPKNMESVADARNPKTFAKNQLEIAVPPGNPAGVTGLADLARPGVKVALCQQQVPCGALAKTVLGDLDVTPVTFGADVKAVLTAVQLGEVDAGLVYRTDVRAAGAKVTGIGIPADRNGFTSYPIATLTDAPAAAAFVSYVLSADGAEVLTGAGFARP